MFVIRWLKGRQVNQGECRQWQKFPVETVFFPPLQPPPAIAAQRSFRYRGNRKPSVRFGYYFFQRKPQQ
jgi:hypothetical protein